MVSASYTHTHTHTFNRKSTISVIPACCGAFITFLYVCFFEPFYAQNVGIGKPPHPTAKLEVWDTTRGVLLPRMNTSQRDNIQSPATGLLIYNTDCNVFQYWNGNQWVTLLPEQVYSPVVFDYTGSPQTWTVPPGVSCVKLKVWGAGGGGGGYDAPNCINTNIRGGHGGGGSYVEATIAVQPGDVLTIYVGGGGGNGDGCVACNLGNNGGWGWGNGGSGACNHGSGGGGGASAVLLNGQVVVVAAGGGGGGAAGNNGNGGDGGGGDQNGFPSGGGAVGGLAGASVTAAYKHLTLGALYAV